VKKRFAALVTASAVGGAVVLGVAGGASGQPSSLPTLNIALAGAKGISVSGSEVSGALNIVTTFSGTVPKGSQASVAIARLNPGVTLQQAFQAVQSHNGDENALTPLGAVIVAANAPSTVQTVLTPGNYVALNTTSNGLPAAVEFTVTQSSSPASLPAAKATQTAIEFGFHGPRLLHRGTMVRAQNQGYLVHMIDLIGVRKKAFIPRVMRMLRAGAPQKAFRPFLNGQFVSLLDPASPGAMQQFVLRAKPGFYVEACFMDTQDHREHTQLGMERPVRVVK
jgi:hypothetical protein